MSYPIPPNPNLPDPTKDLHDRLAAHLFNKHGAHSSYSSSGEQIVQLDNNVGLMILIEIYDQKTGEHNQVPLHSLLDILEN